MSNLLDENVSPAAAPVTPTPIIDSATPAGNAVNFLDALPEDIRNEPSLGSFKDIAALAKSYVSAQRMLGSSIRIPGEDASVEAKAEFFKKLESVPNVVRLPDEADQASLDQFLTKLGRPDKADAYDLKSPEGIEASPETVAEFKKLAFDLGLNKKQTQQLFEFNSKLQLSEKEDLVRNHAENGAKVKQLWGEDYDNRLTAAKLVAKSYADKMPDEMRELANSPISNNPALLQILADYGKTLHEKQALTGSGTLNFVTTPAEALEQIAEIRGNYGHAFHDASNPSHAAAVEKMSSLYQSVHGRGRPEDLIVR